MKFGCKIKIIDITIGTYSNEPASCISCGAGRYNKQVGGTSTDSCNACPAAPFYLALDKSDCVAYGSDPLPNGNGEYTAAKRVGSLGGVVDDLYQDYYMGGKPAGSMSTAEAIAKHGPIETWDTSEVTNMKYVFYRKKNINPDIGKWIVESVTTMYGMFYRTDSFNIDLSGWIVSSVTSMNVMFFQGTAYNQTLCGNTWIESGAYQTNMFKGAGTGAKIGIEPCNCRLGEYLTTTSPKTCSNCPNGKYQDELGFTGTSCTKTCGSTHICCSGWNGHLDVVKLQLSHRHVFK